jgi:hypothetical protein
MARVVAAASCFVVLLVTGTTTPVQGASPTVLRLDPASGQMVTGETITLALRVDNVQDLHRVEVHMSYDDAGLQVQDARSAIEGVQIQPDSFFQPSCIVWNEAAAGEIHFVAFRSPVDGSFSGSGVLAYIRLLVTATTPGPYEVSFNRATTKLLDDVGGSVGPAQYVDSVLSLPSPLVTVTGQVTRDGWGSDERSAVSAVIYPAASGHGPFAFDQGCSDPMGGFVLDTQASTSPPAGILPPGSPPAVPACTTRRAYVRLGFTNYLGQCFWECADGGTVDIGVRELKGGDVNGDGCVNISDIVQIIGDFGDVTGTPCHIASAECPPEYPALNAAPTSDLNGDCQVNVLDLSQAAGSFGLCSNCP